MWHSFDAFRKRVTNVSLTVAIDWSVNMNWFIIPVFASNCHLFFRFALLWFLPMPFNGPTMRVSLCVHQPNWFHFTWGFLPWKCCVSGYSCVRKYHIIHICRVHMLPSAWHIVSRIRCVFLLTYRKYLACARVCVCVVWVGSAFPILLPNNMTHSAENLWATGVKSCVHAENMLLFNFTYVWPNNPRIQPIQLNQMRKFTTRINSKQLARYEANIVNSGAENRMSEEKCTPRNTTGGMRWKKLIYAQQTHRVYWILNGTNFSLWFHLSVGGWTQGVLKTMLSVKMFWGWFFSHFWLGADIVKEFDRFSLPRTVGVCKWYGFDLRVVLVLTEINIK